MKNIILVFCQKDDLHADAVASRLSEMGLRGVLLNREDYGLTWSLTAILARNAFDVIIQYFDEIISLKHVRAVYNRRDFTVESQDVTGDHSAAEKHYIAVQRSIHVNSLLIEIANRSRTMNAPLANRLASSKIAQLSKAMELGFNTPDTFVGGSPLVGYDFQSQTTGGLIIKPLEAVHIKEDGITRAHYTADFRRRTFVELQSLSNCPTFLQSKIEKLEELRVTIVGESIFACSIETSGASADAKADWRHFDWANTPHYTVSLPADLREKLILLMRNFGLSYGAVDLIKRPDGEYFFLEVNSMGQWLWIEELTELPITQAIADWLAADD